MYRIMIVMGSTSDYSIVMGCLELIKRFGIEYKVHVCSAHRSPFRIDKIVFIN